MRKEWTNYVKWKKASLFERLLNFRNWDDEILRYFTFTFKKPNFFPTWCNNNSNNKAKSPSKLHQCKILLIKMSLFKITYSSILFKYDSNAVEKSGHIPGTWVLINTKHHLVFYHCTSLRHCWQNKCYLTQQQFCIISKGRHILHSREYSSQQKPSATQQLENKLLLSLSSSHSIAKTPDRNVQESNSHMIFKHNYYYYSWVLIWYCYNNLKLGQNKTFAQMVKRV